LLQSVRNLPTVSHTADGSGNMLFRFEAAIKEFCEVFVDPLLEKARRSSYGNREVLTAEQTTLRDTAARFRKVLAALADTINSNDSSLSAEQELQAFLYHENLSQQSMSSAGLSPDSPQISSSVRKSVSLQKQIELQASTRKNIQHVIVHWKRSAGRSVHGDVDASRFKTHTPLKTDARRMIGNISQMLVADPARIVEVEQMLKDVQTRDSARRA
jgi:hypothetical protein